MFFFFNLPLNSVTYVTFQTLNRFGYTQFNKRQSSLTNTYLSYFSQRHSGLSFEIGNSFISRSSSCIDVAICYLCWERLYLISILHKSHHLGISERSNWDWLFNMAHGRGPITALLFNSIILHDRVRRRTNGFHSKAVLGGDGWFRWHFSWPRQDVLTF